MKLGEMILQLEGLAQKHGRDLPVVTDMDSRILAVQYDDEGDFPAIVLCIP